MTVGSWRTTAGTISLRTGHDFLHACKHRPKIVWPSGERQLAPHRGPGRGHAHSLPGFRAEFRFHPAAFQDFSALRPELSGSRAPTLPLLVERPTPHPRSCLTTLTAFSPPPSSLLRCRPGGLVTVSLPRPARLLRPPPPPENRLANLLLADRSHPTHRFQRLGRGYAKFLVPDRGRMPVRPPDC